MEISGPLNLLPQSRPPPKYETFNRREGNAEQIPRIFPAGVPAMPKPQIQRVPPSQLRRNEPQQDPDTNPWKLTREFDDTVGVYGQPEAQPYQQELNQQPELTPQIQPGPRSGFEDMAHQRETVPIGYDPSHRTQQDSEPDQLHTTDLTNRSAAENEGTASAVSQAGVALARESDYSPAWITDESHDITNREFYDHDADDGSYTYEPVQPAGHVEATNQTSAVDEEFERPRQVPYNHRQTLFVVKEDIDFYLALLGGQDPPPATNQTQALVSHEQEVRRRSQESIVQESSVRRKEELEDTESDVDFWMALMEKA